MKSFGGLRVVSTTNAEKYSRLTVRHSSSNRSRIVISSEFWQKFPNGLSIDYATGCLMSTRFRTRSLRDAKFGARRTLPDIPVKLMGLIGPKGLSEEALDLLDLGIAVFAIERSLPGAPTVNRTVAFDVEMS